MPRWFWILIAVSALLWSGLAALAWGLAGWLHGWSAQGLPELGDWGRQSLPAWLALWIDPLWLAALQALLREGLDGAGALQPWISALLAWLQPLVIGVWVLGLAGLMLAGLAWRAVAATAHRELGRMRGGT